MSWVRLPDDYWCDPRVLALSSLARDLMTRLLSYCGQRDNDGTLAEREVAVASAGHPGVTRRTKLLAELVAADFLERTPSGYQVAAFDRHLRPRAEVERDRAIRQAGGRARAEQAQRDSGRFTPNQQAAGDANQQPAGVTSSIRPVPSLPVGRKVLNSLPSEEKNATEPMPTWTDVDTRDDCENFRASAALKAWRRRWKYPPSDPQLAMLEPICKAYPDQVGGWIGEAPAGNTYAAIEYVRKEAQKVKDAAEHAREAEALARRDAEREAHEARVLAEPPPVVKGWQAAVDKARATTNTGSATSRKAIRGGAPFASPAQPSQPTLRR